MIKQIIITAILLSVLSGCTGFYVKKAGNLEDNGRLEEAVEVWDKVLKRNPEHITALINRAVDKSLLGDYSGAIDDYTGVIAIDSTMVLAWFNRGKNKKKAGQYRRCFGRFQ